MKKLLMLSFVAVVGAANAQTLWYGGDANGVNGLTSERNLSVADAQTYDHFHLSTASNITGVFGNFLDGFNGGNTTAFVDIRQGISEGNGGTSVFSGVFNVTSADQAQNFFGFEVFRYTAAISTTLAAGDYYLAISPINSGSGRDFIATTSGANAVNNVGHPDGNQWLNSSQFGANYTNWQNLLGTGNWDVSYGVLGSPVPEPASMAVLGIGALALIRRRRSAKK